MKKLLSIFAIAFLALTLAACGEEETTDTTTPVVEAGDFEDVADGYYFAADDRQTSTGEDYRYWVSAQVKDGKLVDLKWDAYHVDGSASKLLGNTKYVGSYKGLYGMTARAESAWYVQASRAMNYILETQDMDITFDENGDSDDIAGISIHYKELVDLLDTAIDSDAVDTGIYNDGYYHVTGEVDEDGYYDMFTAVVVNGTIVLADFNNYHPKTVDHDGDTETDDETVMTKDSMKELYGMKTKVEGRGDTSQGSWYVQAERVEDYVLANQSLDITLNSDGETDTVANVTVGADGFVAIFDKFVVENANSKPAYQYADVADGFYFAAEEEFGNGIKYFVILEVRNGLLVDAELNGYAQDGDAYKCAGETKLACSEAGNYGMNAENPWYGQSLATTQYAIDNQILTGIHYTDEDGNTDVISGVTIHVNEFFDLAQEAIDAGAVAEGTYEDGFYFVTGTADDKGYYDMFTSIVVNGTIVLADFNNYHPKTVDHDADTTTADKELLTKDSLGELYGMDANNGDNTAGPWFEQAERVEEYVLVNQDLGITVTERTTDDVTDVSIKVDGFVTVFDLFETEATPAE